MVVGAQRKPSIRIKALEKKKQFPFSLASICLDRIAETYLQWDPADLKQLLTKKQLDQMYQKLPTDLPLPEATRRIADEGYWKRRVKDTDPHCQVHEHGHSWKQACLEGAVERIFDGMTHGDDAMYDELREIVSAGRAHIYNINIKTHRSHVDPSFLVEELHCLCSFSITCGEKRIGMDYERALFGMKIFEARYLARMFRTSQTLIKVSLQANMIDDELVKVLCTGLHDMCLLTYLDVSHNKIGDRGARKLAKLLGPEHSLQTLNLADNHIHANGAMHLGAHLASNITLEHLDVHLNRFEDNGVSHLFQDLSVNQKLKYLNVSGNDLTPRCLMYFQTMLHDNESLTEINMSGNSLGLDTVGDGDDGEVDIAEEALRTEKYQEQVNSIVQSVLRHNALRTLEIGLCGLPEESEIAIAEACKKRQLELEGIPYDMYVSAKEARLNATTAAQAKAATLEEEDDEGDAVDGGDEDVEEDDEEDAEEDED